MYCSGFPAGSSQDKIFFHFFFWGGGRNNEDSVQNASTLGGGGVNKILVWRLPQKNCFQETPESVTAVSLNKIKFPITVN